MIKENISNLIKKLQNKLNYYQNMSNRKSEIAENLLNEASVRPRIKKNKYQFTDVETKRLLVKNILSGRPLKEAAEIAGIKLNTARTIMYRYRANGGKLIIKKRNSGKIKLNSYVMERIQEIWESYPNITYNGIREILLDTYKITLSLGTVKNGLDQIKRSLIKNKITGKCRENSIDIKPNPHLEMRHNFPTIQTEEEIIDSDTKSLCDISSNVAENDPLTNNLNTFQCVRQSHQNSSNRTEQLLEQIVQEQRRTNSLLENTLNLLLAQQQIENRRRV